jgi:site-specific DNA-methyltransferase (adenine-specific)
VLEPYYADEWVTIYHGDALKVLPGISDVALVVTDPPYFQSTTRYVPPRAEKIRKSIADMSILELAFRSWAEAMVCACMAGATIYLFCDGQSYPLAFTALYPHAHHVRPLVWDKVVSFNGYTWRHQHELIAWAEMDGATRVPTGDGDILRYRAVPVGDREHPAQKPIELLSALIAKHDDGLVLDPFVGSGTTLRAAKDLGRKAIGVEIEERYCEIAAKRCAQEVLAL